jgi:hypothetical protein
LFAIVAGRNETVDAIIHEWDVDLNIFSLSEQNISFSPASRSGASSKVVLVVPKQRMAECIQYIANREEVIWVEEKPQHTTTNVRATKIVQGGISSTQHVLWNEGLTGQGQIIGIGDTGLDVNSPFFSDSANPVVFCETPYDNGK